MSTVRSKDYKLGDKVTINLGRSIPDEVYRWLNDQHHVSGSIVDLIKKETSKEEILAIIDSRIDKHLKKFVEKLKGNLS